MFTRLIAFVSEIMFLQSIWACVRSFVSSEMFFIKNWAIVQFKLNLVRLFLVSISTSSVVFCFFLQNFSFFIRTLMFLTYFFSMLTRLLHFAIVTLCSYKEFGLELCVLRSFFIRNLVNSYMFL